MYHVLPHWSHRDAPPIWEVAGLEENLLVARERKNTDRGTLITAARALMQIDQDKNAGLLGVILTTDSADLELRKQMAAVLGEFHGKTSRSMLAVVKDAPPALQTEVVKALINSPGSIALVFRSEEHTSELQSLMRLSYA